MRVFFEFLFLACLSTKTLKKRNKNVKKTVPSQGAQNPKSTDVKYHGKNLAKSGDSGQFSRFWVPGPDRREKRRKNVIKT